MATENERGRPNTTLHHLIIYIPQVLQLILRMTMISYNQ